ncbi:MAG: hypothetical protein FWH01_02745 [Oscillospiraceae bacterium]|nr:hypothetical protein [Oscillospiraceae bacterium]
MPKNKSAASNKANNSINDINALSAVGEGGVSSRDVDILRSLADRVAAIAASDRNNANRERWRRVNDLRPERPVVMCYAMPWNELNVDDELTLACASEYARSLETDLRRQLYMHRHMPLDMVVEPYIKCRAVVENSGYGVKADDYVLKTDETSAVGAHRYNSVINSMMDVESLRPAVIYYDETKTAELLGTTQKIFDGVMEVKLVCLPEQERPHAPWDDFVHMMGAENVFMSLMDRPEMMTALAKRYNDLAIDAMIQYERLGIMTQNTDNSFIGSGGYGYTDDIPAADSAGAVTASNMWGSCKAQIFTSISTEMFEEFAINFELDWLNRFALTYYGCCEALENKIGVLKKIKNLRKISISAWADPYIAAEQIGGSFVYSYKPDPALLASETLDEQAARKELQTAVDAARRNNCSMEILMKTLSTVSYNPQKLWRWAQIAQEVAESV